MAGLGREWLCLALFWATSGDQVADYCLVRILLILLLGLFFDLKFDTDEMTDFRPGLIVESDVEASTAGPNVFAPIASTAFDQCT